MNCEYSTWDGSEYVQCNRTDSRTYCGTVALCPDHRQAVECHHDKAAPLRSGGIQCLDCGEPFASLADLEASEADNRNR